MGPLSNQLADRIRSVALCAPHILTDKILTQKGVAICFFNVNLPG